MTKVEPHTKKVIAKAIKTFGRQDQMTVCAEECAELIQAINKLSRSENEPCSLSPDFNRTIARENLCEEIADVKIAISLLQEMFDISDDEITYEQINKLKRLDKRASKVREGE